jgi:ATP-dependent Clp protease ATP-binding subunit ClpC
MFEKFTEHARRVLQLEGLEAQQMHHAYLGTEHLLLALMHEKYGHGHRALEELGLKYRQVRQAVEKLVEGQAQTDVPDGFHQTPRAKHVMAVAVEEARKLHSTHIGTEHLLLALLAEPEGVAMKALATLGVTAEAVRQEVLSLIEDDKRQAV